MADALAVAESGAFAVVLECIPRELAAKITAQSTIPTIGIGAGPHCDGQVLVFHDMLGLFEGYRPKFVRQYADARRADPQARWRGMSPTSRRAFPGRSRKFSLEQPTFPASPAGAAEKLRSRGHQAELRRVDRPVLKPDIVIFVALVGFHGRSLQAFQMLEQPLVGCTLLPQTDRARLFLDGAERRQEHLPAWVGPFNKRWTHAQASR